MSDFLKMYLHWQLRTSDGPSGMCQRERECCPEIKTVSCNDVVVRDLTVTCRQIPVM